MTDSPQNPDLPWHLMAFLADAIGEECSDKQAQPTSSATLNCPAAGHPAIAGRIWLARTSRRTVSGERSFPLHQDDPRPGQDHRRLSLFTDPRPGPKGPRKATGELRARVLALRAAGHSVTEIAAALTADGLPVSPQTPGRSWTPRGSVGCPAGTRAAAARRPAWSRSRPRNCPAGRLPRPRCRTTTPGCCCCSPAWQRCSCPP